jgi:hypothetical protein
MKIIPLHIDPINIEEAFLTQGAFFCDLGERSEVAFENLSALSSQFNGHPSAASYSFKKIKWLPLYRKSVNRCIFTFNSEQNRTNFLLQVKELYGK